MGCYVNPTNESKETFLRREGTQVTTLSWADRPADTLPVVLFFNPAFTAAGIAYSERELQAFTEPNDYRRKVYYYVPISKLEAVSPIKEYLNG